MPHRSQPHHVTAAQFPPPLCHVLAPLRSTQLHTYCGYNISEASSKQLGVMTVSEKCIHNGPPKMTGWLRHLIELPAACKRTGALLSKYSVFPPYKQQLFDLVLLGLLVYNLHFSVQAYLVLRP